jgi:hypothetical protein
LYIPARPDCGADQGESRVLLEFKADKMIINNAAVY